MSRVAYVNGRYVCHNRATVHVEDRGYQFADGVYEVVAVVAGRLIDEPQHLQRLGESLAKIGIAWPISREVLQLTMRQMIRRNKLLCQRGFLYIQVTRGVARRNHAFPQKARPSLVMTAYNLPPFDLVAASRGVRVITVPDERWRRPDIKSVGLLPNVSLSKSTIENLAGVLPSCAK